MHWRAACLFVLLSTRWCGAVEIFVDNLGGSDAYDGTLPVARQDDSGPVRSLMRASELAGFGDTIVLKNTGRPYYDSLSLTGHRHSGTSFQPFTVVGNGATLSGLRSVRPEGWHNVGPKLWKLTLTRKGYYQLLRNGHLLTEFRPENGDDPTITLPPAQWVSFRGSIYFRQDGNDAPERQAFAVTSDQTGISLHQVSNVLIVDLKVQHFRFDGIHAQGICHGVELENVSALENGRAGIVASGGSQIHLFGGASERNGRIQLMAQDRSAIFTHLAPEPPESADETSQRSQSPLPRRVFTATELPRRLIARD